MFQVRHPDFKVVQITLSKEDPVQFQVRDWWCVPCKDACHDSECFFLHDYRSLGTEEVVSGFATRAEAEMDARRRTTEEAECSRCLAAMTMKINAKGKGK